MIHRQTLFRLTGALVAALVMGCNAAAADLRVIVEESVNNADPVEVTHWFGGDRSLRDDGGRYIITRLDQGQSFIVDRGKRAYKSIPLHFDDTANAARLSVEPTEDYQQIGPWKARRYRLSGPATRGLTIDLWLSQDVSADIDQFRRLMVRLSGRKGSEWLRAYEQMEGFPVLQQVELKRRGITLRTESRVVAISDVKPRSGLYQPPESYRLLP